MSTQLQTQAKTGSKSSDTASANNAAKRHFSSQRGFTAEAQRYPIHAKLKIGQPGDKYELEADQVAEQVMRMPEPKVQRMCPEYKEELKRQPLEEEEELQAKPVAGQITPLIQRQVEEEEEEELIQTKIVGDVTPKVTPAINSGIQSLQGGGRPMSRGELSFFEPRFGTDFSNVRVHNNARAANVARSVDARAFTFRNNVVFGAGEYSSDTLSSRQLLAHELAHVVQQSTTKHSDLTPVQELVQRLNIGGHEIDLEHLPEGGVNINFEDDSVVIDADVWKPDELVHINQLSLPDIRGVSLDLNFADSEYSVSYNDVEFQVSTDEAGTTIFEVSIDVTAFFPVVGLLEERVGDTGILDLELNVPFTFAVALEETSEGPRFRESHASASCRAAGEARFELWGQELLSLGLGGGAGMATEFGAGPGGSTAYGLGGNVSLSILGVEVFDEAGELILEVSSGESLFRPDEIYFWAIDVFISATPDSVFMADPDPESNRLAVRDDAMEINGWTGSTDVNQAYQSIIRQLIEDYNDIYDTNLTTESANCGRDNLVEGGWVLVEEGGVLVEEGRVFYMLPWRQRMYERGRREGWPRNPDEARERVGAREESTRARITEATTGED